MVQEEAEVIPAFEFFFQQLGTAIGILIILIILSLVLPWLIKKILKPRKKICSCGNELKPEDKFCSKCGKKVE